MVLNPNIAGQLDEATLSYLAACDSEVIGFVNSLGDKELTALKIAVSQLGSSFDISKSIGFLTPK